jgi:hypothetical protein
MNQLKCSMMIAVLFIHYILKIRLVLYLILFEEKRTQKRSDKTAANSIQHVIWDVNVDRFNSKCLYSFVFHLYRNYVKEHDKFVKCNSSGAIHREYLRKILCTPHNNFVMSSNGDSRNSLIITNLNKLKKPYIFRLYKIKLLFYNNKNAFLVIIHRVVNVLITAKH